MTVCQVFQISNKVSIFNVLRGQKCTGVVVGGGGGVCVSVSMRV